MTIIQRNDTSTVDQVIVEKFPISISVGMKTLRRAEPQHRLHHRNWFPRAWIYSFSVGIRKCVLHYPYTQAARVWASSNVCLRLPLQRESSHPDAPLGPAPHIFWSHSMIEVTNIQNLGHACGRSTPSGRAGKRATIRSRAGIRVQTSKISMQPEGRKERPHFHTRTSGSPTLSRPALTGNPVAKTVTET